MKIIVVIFCLISTKAALSIDGSSPQEMRSFRRNQSPPNLHQRINLNVAKLLILKQLLESDCIKGITYQHPKSDRQMLSSKAGFDGVSLSKTKPLSNTRNQVISDDAQTKYFLNPKIIMVPSLKNSVKSVTNDFKNQKRLNVNKNPTSYSQNSAGHRKEVELTGTTKRESFPRVNNKGRLHETINTSKTTVSTSDAKIPRIPLHPTSVDLPKMGTTPNPFNSLKTNGIQTYEVEEIIEGTMDVDQGQGYDFLGNEIKNIPNGKQEQEVIDNSLKKILSSIMGLEKNTPSVQKQSSPETTTKFHPYAIGVSQNGTKLKPDPSSGGNNFFKRPDDDSVRVKPINENYQNFETKPQSNNKYFNFHTENEKKEEKSDIKKPPTVSHPLFKFFSKGPAENQRLKPKNLNYFTLPPISSHELRPMFEKNTKLELTTDFSPTGEAFTTTVHPINRMLNFHNDPRNTEYNFGIDKEKVVGHISPTTFKTITNHSKVTSSEFSDPALTIDLFFPSIKPELKKDQELNGKNSRKMHFNQHTNKEIILDQVTENPVNEPRRSDILIADGVEEYINDENQVSSLGYLKRINPNNTILTDDSLTDMKLDSYISFIPHILNDIRGNKISRQDYAVLSKVFGKYWPKILQLSSKTEVDVLPLLQLKNENDLANFLENYFSNEIKTSTIESIELKDYGKNYPEQFYDYMYEYKDFYDMMLNQEPGEKGKRHKKDKEQVSEENEEI